jgi:hypothetical protein
MKLKQRPVKTARPCGPGRIVRHHSFGVLSNHMRPLLVVVLAATIVLATGCASTGTSFGARLMLSPLSANQQPALSEDDSSYQPPRSPGFNDLFGS